MRYLIGRWVVSLIFIFILLIGVNPPKVLAGACNFILGGYRDDECVNVRTNSEGLNCPYGGYPYYSCNRSGNQWRYCWGCHASTPGGGPPGVACQGITGNKYISPGDQSIAPAIGQQVTLMPGYQGQSTANPYAFMDGGPGAHLLPNPDTERFTLSVPALANYNVSYSFHSSDPTDNGLNPPAGPNLGSSAVFLCRWGTMITINWYFTPIGCSATPPTGPWTERTPTTATLHWNHGSDETLQLIRVDADRTQVESGCPGGCKVKADFRSLYRGNPDMFCVHIRDKVRGNWRGIAYNMFTCDFKESL